MKNKKIEFLRGANAYNHNPEKVVDPLFLENAFFDANDIVQVKYEMLRRQRVDKMPVQGVASSFGFSKVTFYEVQHAFEQEGVLGLQPKKRGPKQMHKLIPEIIEFAKEKIQQDSNLRFEDLLALIQKEYGVSLHKRTLERGLNAKKKETIIKKLRDRNFKHGGWVFPRESPAPMLEIPGFVALFCDESKDSTQI